MLMAEMLGAKEILERRQEKRDQMQKMKERAQELYSKALDKSNELFDSGDLSPYLSTLVHLHKYNYYNLLLILLQYPTATNLKNFNEWRKMIPNSNDWVLKKGVKGIELIAPFTDIQQNGVRSLSWFAINQFDITQTNIPNLNPTPSIYFSGVQHKKTLIRALRSLLRNNFGATIFMDLYPQELYGFAGQIKGSEIHCHNNLSDNDFLLWFSECLLIFLHPEKEIGERYTRMFIQMAQHCLFRIWEITDSQLLFLPDNKEIIQNIPFELRTVFLNLLQCCVRNIVEGTCCYYKLELSQKEDSNHSEFVFNPY